MEAIMIKETGLSIFILHIVISGQINTTRPSFSLKELKIAIPDYLGVLNVPIADNLSYARIVQIDMNNPKQEREIWFFNFKCATSLSDSISTINTEEFDRTNEALLRSIINVALGRNIEGFADLIFDTLQSTLQLSNGGIHK